MLRYSGSEISRKADVACVDGDRDFDLALLIATRFGVSPSVAGLIAELSGLRGGGDSRWTKA